MKNKLKNWIRILLHPIHHFTNKRIIHQRLKDMRQRIDPQTSVTFKIRG